MSGESAAYWKKRAIVRISATVCFHPTLILFVYGEAVKKFLESKIQFFMSLLVGIENFTSPAEVEKRLRRGVVKEYAIPELYFHCAFYQNYRRRLARNVYDSNCKLR